MVLAEPTVLSSRKRLGRSRNTVRGPLPSGEASCAVTTIERMARSFSIPPRASRFFAMISSTVCAWALTASATVARAETASRIFIVPPAGGPPLWDPCGPHAADVDGSLNKTVVHNPIAGKEPAMPPEASARAHGTKAREVLKQVELFK